MAISLLQTKSRICHGRGIQQTPKTIGQRCRSYGILESLDIEKCPPSGHWSQQIANDITEEVSQQKVQASFTIDVALPHDDNCGRLLYPDGETSFSGHTHANISATAIPMETSANRWKATCHGGFVVGINRTIASVTPPNRYAFRSVCMIEESNPRMNTQIPNTSKCDGK